MDPKAHLTKIERVLRVALARAEHWRRARWHYHGAPGHERQALHAKSRMTAYQKAVLRLGWARDEIRGAA